MTDSAEVTPRMEQIIRDAVREGMSVLTADEVWRDIANALRAEYSGRDGLRRAIRQAVRAEFARRDAAAEQPERVTDS